MTLLNLLEPELLVLVVCGRSAIESPNKPIDVDSLKLSPDSIASLALAHPRLWCTLLASLKEAEPDAKVPRCLAIAAPLVWIALCAQEAADARFATMRAARRPNSIKKILPLVTCQLLTDDLLVRYALHPHASRQGCVFLHNLHGGGRSVEQAVRTTQCWIRKNVALLRLGVDWQKEAAAEVLGNFAWVAEFQVAIAEVGGIPLLVALACGGTDGQKENATWTLWWLAANDDNKVAIAEAGGIAPLVALLSDGSFLLKEWAALALGSLALNVDNKVAIAEAGGIAPLVALARDGTGGQQEDAAAALKNLAINADNKVAIAEAGGIAPLVALARDGSDGQKENAAGALATLAINADNKVAIAEAGGIVPLVALAHDGTENQKKWAGVALRHLALNADNQVAIAQAAGVLAAAAV
jgi:vacuolar protein 8